MQSINYPTYEDVLRVVSSIPVISIYEFGIQLLKNKGIQNGSWSRWKSPETLMDAADILTRLEDELEYRYQTPKIIDIENRLKEIRRKLKNCANDIENG